MTPTLKDELGPAHAMMSRVLRDGGSLADEYPLVFGPGFPGRLVALSEGEEVRSACAVLVRDLVMGARSMRVGLVGSVSTHPDHRHTGCATRVLARAEDELRERGCVLSLLWADEPDFYFHRGYRPVGTELDLALETGAAERLPSAADVREARPEDAAAIHELYTHHRERVDRTVEETAALLDCPEMRVLVQDGERGPEAYACAGRGRDLRGVVHEWGGSLRAVLGLVRAQAEAMAAESGPSRLFVMAPAQRADVRLALTEAGAVANVGVLGLGKLLDRRAAADLLRSATGAAAELEDESAGRRVRVLGSAGTRVYGDEELLDLLLPAHGDRTALTNAAREVGLRTTELPLPAFVWGLDSI